MLFSKVEPCMSQYGAAAAQESSSEVRDPNAFIVARARRAAAAPGSTSPRAETARLCIMVWHIMVGHIITSYGKARIASAR